MIIIVETTINDEVLMLKGKQFYVAKANNFGDIEIEFFTDVLAYGRAVRDAIKEHDRVTWHTYLHGSNSSSITETGEPVLGEFYVATMGNMGLDVSFYSTDSIGLYADTITDLEMGTDTGVDSYIYNGPGVSFDPDDYDEDEGDLPESVIGYQIVDKDGMNIHGLEGDPFGLHSFEILAGEAVVEAFEKIEGMPGLSLKEVRKGEIEEPQFVDRLSVGPTSNAMAL